MKRSSTQVSVLSSTPVMQIISATTKVLKIWSTPCSTSTARSTLLPPGPHGLSMGSPPGSSRTPDPYPTFGFSGLYPTCKLPDLNSPHRPQGWPPCSCLHRREPTVWEACFDHVQPGGGWPTDLFNITLRVDSENYTQ